jgi:hypothetical protein
VGLAIRRNLEWLPVSRRNQKKREHGKRERVCVCGAYRGREETMIELVFLPIIDFNGSPSPFLSSGDKPITKKKRRAEDAGNLPPPPPFQIKKWGWLGRPSSSRGGR